MTPNELRIGNFLTSKEWKGIGKVEGIEVIGDGFEIRVNGYVHTYEKDKYFDLNPIPLDQEWAERFGFEKSTDWYRKGKHAINFSASGLYEFCNIPIKNVIYVHKFQNLFYELEGEELKFKR